jgi:phosphoglycolate phosphatase
MELLFDLDGTLTDPFIGITKCIQSALLGLGYPAPSADSLAWCIGPPLKKSFEKLLGSNNDDLLEKAILGYRERYTLTGIFENTVYNGVEYMLKDLNNLGFSLRIATSKPSVFANRIIDHFSLTRYFQSVDGSELDGTRSDKAELIAHILERDAIVPTDAIMIGDRKHDIIAARKNGIIPIGVLWGYGSVDELKEAGAQLCISSPQDLVSEMKAISKLRGKFSTNNAEFGLG